MTQFKIIRVSDVQAPDAIRFRVDRKTHLGNPYVLGAHGNRERVINLFDTWLKSIIAASRCSDARLLRWNELRALDYLNTIVQASKNAAVIELACHCCPLDCHARIIAETIQRLGL